MIRGTILLMAAFVAARAGDWSAPADVQHDFKTVVSYRAMLNGDTLVVEARLEPGWHTFAMDNQRRADEKLAGKMSLGIDRATEIRLDAGFEATGGWMQTPPKDFSKPDL